jgi:hypothetical protein
VNKSPSEYSVRIALRVIAAEFDTTCPDYEPGCIDCEAKRVWQVLKDLLDEGEFAPGVRDPVPYPLGEHSCA